MACFHQFLRSQFWYFYHYYSLECNISFFLTVFKEISPFHLDFYPYYSIYCYTGGGLAFTLLGVLRASWTPQPLPCRKQSSVTVASALLLELSHGVWSRCRPQPCHPPCKNPRSPPRPGRPTRTPSSRAWWHRIPAFRTHCTGHPAYPPASLSY